MTFMNATVSGGIANIALLHLPWPGGLMVVGEKMDFSN